MDNQILSMFIINGISAAICLILGMYYIVEGNSKAAKGALQFVFLMAVLGTPLLIVAILFWILISLEFLFNKLIDWLCSFSKNNR